MPDAQEKSLEAAIPDDQSGRDVTSLVIDHLFGDLALFASEILLGEIPPDDYEVVKCRECLSKMHLLDALDVVNDVENEMSQDTRTTLLHELVQELKERLPKSYDKAWNHPDSKYRERWREAIRKELHSLIHIRKVWIKIKRSQIPKGRRCVKSKWVFDVK